AEQESQALGVQYPNGHGALKKDLHAALPAPDQGIAPVVPDIIGEALVLSTLEQESEAELVVVRAAKQAGRAVPAFVVRAAQDFSGDESVEPRKRLKPLEWLEVLIRSGSSDDLGLLLEIEGAMPEHTLVLREKAAEVAQLLVDKLSDLAAKKLEEV